MLSLQSVLKPGRPRVVLLKVTAVTESVKDRDGAIDIVSTAHGG